MELCVMSDEESGRCRSPKGKSRVVGAGGPVRWEVPLVIFSLKCYMVRGAAKRLDKQKSCPIPAPLEVVFPHRLSHAQSSLFSSQKPG